MLRTDGKENIISSIEIAAAVGEDGHARVPGVSLYFQNELYRGNRATKYNAENFMAFRSPNYRVLADVGIHIKYNDYAIERPSQWGEKLKVNDKLDNRVAVCMLYPGQPREVIEMILSQTTPRAFIIETFGCGNAPSSEWFLNAISRCIERGQIVVNVTQCLAGGVDMDAYANGLKLKRLGVISAYDITKESAITKLYHLLGMYESNLDVKTQFMINLCGEFSKKDFSLEKN
jgi:L-asparaginase